MTSPRSTQIITDRVKPKDELLEHGDIKSYFKPWSDYSKIHAFSSDYAKKSDPNPTSVIWEPATPHGFASAIIHAYTLHQHLRFSPDDVWLTVAQGVSRHIKSKAENYRHLFVNHEGREEVYLDARDILDYKSGNIVGDWPQAITRLSDAADSRCKKVDLKQLLKCDFSTSTNASITASQILLLDAMKKYFIYRLRGGCGIPKVTLDGTLEDWLHLQEKVSKLRGLGLEIDPWLDKLEPVISQFVATYKGNVDEEFWSMVVSKVPYSTFDEGPCWDGWISALFPNNRDSIPSHVTPSDVPSGLVFVPFKLNIDEPHFQKDFQMKFASGFLGVRQDKINEEYVVSPVIGWYIVDGGGETLAYNHTTVMNSLITPIASGNQ